MFNWICPQCGSEVLASYAECPECAKRAQGTPAQPEAPAPSIAAQAPPPAAAPPVSQPEPPRSVPFTPPRAAPVQPAPPQYYMQPPARGGMPTWLLSIVFALAFVGLGAGVYWAIQHFKGENAPPVSASGTTLENPAAKGAAKPNPYQKYVEVTGVRLFQNAKKQVEARFLVVNHSEGEMSDLGGTVEIRGRTAREGEEPVGSFTFKVGSIGPNESKELTAKVDTKLKVYELPDWQNVDARVKVSSP